MQALNLHSERNPDVVKVSLIFLVPFLPNSSSQQMLLLMPRQSLCVWRLLYETLFLLGVNTC